VGVFEGSGHIDEGRGGVDPFWRSLRRLEWI
jgi:hypothetical protein